MTKITNTHSLRHDYRIKSLKLVIEGLKNSIEVLENCVKEIHWYGGDWFMEESEPIIGLAFIAFQNYINASIKDYAGVLKGKDEFYELCNNSQGLPRSKIELIEALANYAKHKIEGIPHKAASLSL